MCVDLRGGESVCECVSVNVIEDRVLVVSGERGPWSDRVGTNMLKSAGKRT